MQNYGLHWFRRDLRVAGNPALLASWKRHGGRVVGIFCFDCKFLARPDFSVGRFQLFLETLRQLRDELRGLGSDLLFLDVGPDEAFTAVRDALIREGRPLPQSISWNRDYEPFAVARDRRLTEAFHGWGIQTLTERDHCLIEPHEIYKGEDPAAPYQVFTPFSRRWFEKFSSDEVQERVDAQRAGLRYLGGGAQPRTSPTFSLTWKKLLSRPPEPEDAFEIYHRRNGARVTHPLPPAGSAAAFARLKAFAPKLPRYGDQRDLPAMDGTSQLSLYFKNGSLTVAQVMAHLALKVPRKGEKSGAAKYFTELVWREFYYHILGRFPHVETRSFQPRYENLAWENREDWFQAWKEGLTGFPIVDAGMRQLKTTGWMHNRVRMIVASFLTKDLLIDWRWGEKYFMETLLDGDLAPNNGGWQWAASTGCDAQPYFRVFNPKLQSLKFDPTGTYIRRFVPELNGLNNDDIHEPPPLLRGDYPPPIVDHQEQKAKAIALYKVGA